MKKIGILFLVLFSSMFGQMGTQTSSHPQHEGTYVEFSLGFGWPWDLGPSFRFKGVYGYTVDKALSLHGGLDYAYASRQETLSNTTSSGVTTTMLESDVQAHLIKMLGGVRITWPWMVWENIRVFTELDVGYSLLWNLYSRLTDRNLYFYAGDFLSFQLVPGILIPLGERSQAVIGISLDIASVSRTTPLGEYLVKEKINLSGGGILVGIGFRW
ncbi:MAG: hypothetical protein N2314_04550 [Brevinematales bacterium]|nr:hypothetical protein [Brevinematales bacterium]